MTFVGNFLNYLKKPKQVKISSILLEEDIFPLGNFETLKVRLIKGGLANQYPNVARIGEVQNFSKLDEAFLIAIEKRGKCFVKDRVPYLCSSISLKDIKKTLSEVGFTKESYQSYALRDLGTTNISDIVGGEAREFLSQFPVPFFRSQISIAQPGWKTLFHQDHKNFKIHGFRAMVPLNNSVYMSFLKRGREAVYELPPGGLYFVNIAKLHKGFNPKKEERRILMMQMASDELILRGKELDPIDEKLTVTMKEFLHPKIHELWDTGSID